MLRSMLNYIKSMSFDQSSVQRLAVACSLAVYIAFCPFLGFHTVMAIGIGFIAQLNIPLILGVSYMINNPWTMIPINLSGYVTGYWILHTYLSLSVESLNPVWMGVCNNYFYTYLGFMNVSFWAFMLGGNILGVFFAVICYPVFYVVFTRIKKK